MRCSSSMSQAFMKEGDSMWLHEVAPTMNALIAFLTRENNGIRVNEKRNYYSATFGQDVHEMSDGLSYTKNKDGRWMMVKDW